MTEQHHQAPPGPAHGHGKGTINIPGIGKMPTWAVLGGLGLVGVLIIMHNRKASSSGAAAAAGTSTDPAGNVGTIDPATGFVYGSAEDTAALGSSTASSGDISGGGTSVGDQVTNGPPFTSNAAWAQYAVSVLEGNGYDPGTITAELGLYLAGSPVTAAQQSDINAAVGVAGYPPVSGANGYPPAINVTGSVAGGGPSGGSTGGGPSSGTPATPAGGGPITVTPVALREVTSKTSKNSLQVTWTAPTIPSGQGPLTGYGVACYEAATGHLVNGPFTVSKNQLYANVGGLKSATKYNVNVWCDPAKTGGPHANVQITTHK